MSMYQSSISMKRYQNRYQRMKLNSYEYTKSNSKAIPVFRFLLLGIVLGMVIAFTIAASFILYITNSFDSRVETMKNDYKVTLSAYEDTIATNNTEIEKLNSTITSLRAEIQSQHEHDQWIQEEYGYVLDLAPSNSAITLDVLDYADMKCKAENINAHLLWGIADTESNYNTNAKNVNSSAKGMFQFLESTATTFYENSRFLNHGKGTYDHSMITDPYVAIDLMVEYLVYLRDTRDANVYEMLHGYRGKGGAVLQAYYNDVKNNMAKQRHDITNVYYEG